MSFFMSELLIAKDKSTNKLIKAQYHLTTLLDKYISVRFLHFLQEKEEI